MMVLRLALSFAYPILGLGLIGWGAWQITPWAGPLAVGSLIWIDFQLGSRARGKEDRPK